MSGKVGTSWRGGTGLVLGGLVLGLLASSCEGLWSSTEEPPSRLRSMRQLRRWEVVQAPSSQTAEVKESGALAASPTPAAESSPIYKGVMQTTLEVFQRTELREVRAKALEQAAAGMTDGDATEAYRAVQSGKRLDASIGIALLSRYYDKTGRWDRLEDAYRSLFQSVPELRLSPEHLTEHAVSLAMLGRFKEALERARVADELFRSLPVGDNTNQHLARLAQSQAWAYEGLSREAMKSGIPDAESRSLEQQALQSWERYLRLAKAIPRPDEALREEISRAEEHVGNLRQTANLEAGAAGGAP